ncbi:helix-turn-helix domain-containing protein [Streptomyces sp. SBT349]|uniref:helix-turn-helix domain-containing protein n=1 Tax=Streptomyces sp. SBT349 TaxID=1580539 RepID=UPI000A66E906|nr:helix-turn-helix transcriptional regulator [Streptomyces sp. SBT349]
MSHSIDDEIDAVTVRVYQLRVTHPTDLVSQLAARAGVTAAEVSAAEERLADLGLLQQSPGGGWVAISPESAADALLAPLEQDVLHRRIAMAATRERLHSLSGDYLEARSLRSAGSSVEVVRGIDNIRAVIDDLARTCVSSLDALVPGGGQPEAAISAATPLDLELLGRGVRIRSLFQHSARRHRPTVSYAERINAAGARVRSVGVLPSRLQIYDRVCAVLPLNPGDTASGAALVRDPTVVGFLCQLFDHCWDEGVEFTEVEVERGPEPSGLEREALLMLAAGRSNEEIADRLGLAQRSVSRLVAQLMARLDATNRFQAGVQAASRGWLS